MMEAMREMNFAQCRVLDFGTGTGILAILAKKLGAGVVTAIDNDEWSITNAAENAAMNDSDLLLAQASLQDIAASSYDIVLANINRNILLEHMGAMSAQITPGGVLLLSGILTEDEAVINTAAANAGLGAKSRLVKKDWMALKFIRKE
jgi:ribosomal protein L11 methyltransferase